MTAVTPGLRQRRTALVTANTARRDGKEAKRRIRDLGYREASRILIEEPELIAAMRVHAFLEAVPRMGDTKVRKLLVAQAIWPLRRVGDLTVRQRRVLAVELARLGRAKGWVGE